MADLPVEPRTGYKVIKRSASGSLAAGERMLDAADVADIAAIVQKTCPAGKKVTSYELRLRVLVEDA
jgi:hypothetical protein